MFLLFYSVWVIVSACVYSCVCRLVQCMKFICNCYVLWRTLYFCIFCVCYINSTGTISVTSIMWALPAAGWLVGGVTWQITNRRTSVRSSFGWYDGQLASSAAADWRSWWTCLGWSTSWVRPVGNKTPKSNYQPVRREARQQLQGQGSKWSWSWNGRLRLSFMYICALARLCYTMLAKKKASG